MENKELILPIRRNEYLKIELNEVKYLEVERDYTTFITDREKDIIVCKSLSKILAIIDSECFVRISRNIVVNSNKIKKVYLGKDAKVILQDGTEIIPSFRYKKNLKAKCLSTKI
jgi:DNA-binding LytR/AlgR family response regulator